MEIVIVDDDPMILKVFTKLLEKLGYQATPFNRGRSALDYFQSHQNEIQLIILDMKLDDMTGSEVFQEIHTIKPKQKVIVATGYGLDRDVQILLENGLTDYLEKPFTLEVLKEKLAKHAPKAN